MNTAFSGLFFGLLAADRADLPADRRELPELARSVRDHHRAARRVAGIIWMLFLTGTTLSVPALTGAIMCMGVATANSILVVSFAREKLAEHGEATRAALEAGMTRFRPVLMTALAMVIGMLPMALGLGEGGEQNAPLGRAVIGGLIVATFATLMFVPVIFSLAHRRDADESCAAPRYVRTGGSACLRIRPTFRSARSAWSPASAPRPRRVRHHQPVPFRSPARRLDRRTGRAGRLHPRWRR
jgi:hypothetical protein